jgi:hypothetical protein
MRKPDTNRSGPTLHIKAGEKITFPVSAKHRLAKFQKLTLVRSTDDLYDFLVHWDKFAKAKGESSPTPKDVVARFSKARIRVFRLNTSFIRIGKGAVVTLSNPLNHVQADTIELAGDLVSRGDLILNCTTLSIK